MNDEAKRHLHKILFGREERAWLQKFLLGLCANEPALVQIMLNIPGYPKRVPREAEAVESAERALTARLQIEPVVTATCANEAGYARLLLFSNVDCKALKAEAVRTEEELPWGRALDIDVIARYTNLTNLSRRDLGFPARTCVLCGGDAKICARSRSHALAEVRKIILDMLSSIIKPMSTT